MVEEKMGNHARNTHKAAKAGEIITRLANDGFAVVDGTHRFEGVFIDLFYLNNLMASGSIIFLDDYQIAGVRKAVTFFISNMQWTMEEISEPSETHQWAVVRTRHEPLKRTYKD